FKKFNDTWGHLAGDFVLQQVARTLTATVRDSDLLVRLGGEELAVVMPSTSIDDGAKAAMRFGQAVRSARFDFEGQRLQVSVSIGVAQAIEEDSVTSLIQRADEAMYAAKQNGRDRSWFHDGRACRPAGDEPARLDLASRGGVPKQLESVCDGLRERLIQVTRR
ncbi:MAG TPA: hypothetical protein DCQ98_12230, partial [Planctomycetaceae bacterium]|nr:hypothetical protein [Planctomycetaceae bacterium]